MISKKILNRALLFLIVTATADFVAIKFSLYWTTSWIDMIPHFCGGVTVGLASLWFFSLKSDVSLWTKKRLFFTAFLGAITIGIIWELFELHFGITTVSDGIYYVIDTAKDLTMDTLGGITGFYIVKNLLTKTNNG